MWWPWVCAGWGEGYTRVWGACRRRSWRGRTDQHQIDLLQAWPQPKWLLLSLKYSYAVCVINTIIFVYVCQNTRRFSVCLIHCWWQTILELKTRIASVGNMLIISLIPKQKLFLKTIRPLPPLYCLVAYRVIVRHSVSVSELDNSWACYVL